MRGWGRPERMVAGTRSLLIEFADQLMSLSERWSCDSQM